MEQGIIMTFIIGLVVGVIAKMLKPGKDPGGFIITAVIGIAGAFLAKYIGQAVGWYQPGENAGFIASVVGAIILLVIYAIATKKRTS